jgi:hypothetical protein
MSMWGLYVLWRNETNSKNFLNHRGHRGTH